MNPLHRLFPIFSGTAYFLSSIVEHWQVIAISILIMSPVGPHLRWEYQYRDTFGARYYFNCTYLGSRGIVRVKLLESCPLIIIHDARNKVR